LFFSKKAYLCIKLKKMTVITISTEDKNLLLRLREWLKQNEPKAKIEELSSEINWTDAKLDAATDALVRDSIARRKVGDTSHLIQVNDLKEVFYDL
jgi:hypothetical protein